MNDPENFLSRWSRRKQDAAEASQDAKPAPGTQSAQNSAETTDAEAHAANETQAPRPGPAEATFDLASLPPIESITADTDIRGFFAPGVPTELMRAALRRAWVADPKIRDFVGLEDYAWDFNAPGSIPGFGPLEMNDELRREVARIVGNLVSEDEAVGPTAGRSSQPQEPARQIPASSPPSEDSSNRAPVDSVMATDESQPREPSMLAGKVDTALQQKSGPRENLQTLAGHRHGRALPK